MTLWLGVPSGDEGWLERFRRGDRRTLEACYREHLPRVLAVAGSLVGPEDAETVAHQVFCRLLGEPGMRRGYRGGSLGGWLATVARRATLDLLEKRRREAFVESAALEEGQPTQPPADELVALRQLVERFREQELTPELAAVFDMRFLRQMTQREAARALGIRRTTLAYREMKVRRRLKRFMLQFGRDE